MNTLLDKLRECIQAEIALAVEKGKQPFVTVRKTKTKAGIEKLWQEFAQLLAESEANNG